jgi:hypothetical protein
MVETWPCVLEREVTQMRSVWHKEKIRRLFGTAYEGLGTEKKS